ncbi:phosphomannomutase/phosphoglucomutase [Ignatzschineria rhizosphaerae]|uniref:phosphomannomutase n=1 Tax=Ignatzschineria rhizosphaerae TaxID=2923279 RepID=A0ABY3X0G7_9GAMM|nr:phosphomannomutase/phosphoglucomutase [Ignatzschineria rhizosphaerae]UNM95256.1 phosphomannomutase/phosphoglucomutase [Ignatzschineria rhizosphaerae]
MTIKAFKAYDIRGKYPEDINEDLAYQLGLAFVAQYGATKIIVGRDIRESSPSLFERLVAGIIDAGCDVVSLGICGTEEVYFNTVYQNADGGIMITASHNPKSHNGFKLVGKNAEPISLTTGLLLLKNRILQSDYQLADNSGEMQCYEDRSPYIKTILSFAPELLKHHEVSDNSRLLKIVCNSGNGCAGDTLDRLEPYLPFELIKVHHEPDGSFPNGVPNPLIVERRAATKAAIIKHQADFGVAWDGDFDRCFFFDEKGEFIDSSYVIGLIAEALLKNHPAEKIVIDTRQTLNSESVIKNAGGEAIISAGGHSPMKRTMRQVKALYGGEMSAHHYFREFHYCDSGMIPFLLVSSLLVQQSKTIGNLVQSARLAYPCSGELNYVVQDPASVMAKILAFYQDQAITMDEIDGISLRLVNARINVRRSNTENYLRINIEAEGDTGIVSLLQEQIESILQPYL